MQKYSNNIQGFVWSAAKLKNFEWIKIFSVYSALKNGIVCFSFPRLKQWYQSYHIKETTCIHLQTIPDTKVWKNKDNIDKIKHAHVNEQTWRSLLINRAQRVPQLHITDVKLQVSMFAPPFNKITFVSTSFQKNNGRKDDQVINHGPCPSS